MYRRNERGWFKHLDFLMADLVALELSFAVAVLLRFGFAGPADASLYGKVAVLLVIIHCCVVFFDESYHGILRRGYLIEAKATVKHVVLVVGLLLLYLYLTKQTELARMFFLYFVITSLVLIWVFRCLYKKLLKEARSRPSEKQYRLLVATGSAHVADVLKNLRDTSAKIVGLCLLDQDRIGESLEGIPVVASQETMLDYIKSNAVDGLFISSSSSRKLPDILLETCIRMGTSVHIGIIAPNPNGDNQIIESMGDYTVLTRSVRIASARQLLIKRAVDICAGIAGIVLTGIACLIVGPMIYKASPGPIFFSQTRVGKNGRKFKIYKFRSMYMDAEERKKELMARNKIADGLMFKMDDDPRIIKGIGHFIRDYSIDELPQFINVLRGEMSLIGTRPPTVEEYEKYDYHHKVRLAIKPGITGMWQVSGRSNITDFEEVVKLDASYITNWTLGLDFKILLKTVKVVLQRDGAV